MLPTEFMADIFADIGHFVGGSHGGFVAARERILRMICHAILQLHAQLFYIGAGQKVLFAQHAE
jgi:hypothetical protein